MKNAAAKTLFLPGAGGSASFWKPAADLTGLEAKFFAWPGLGDEPTDPAVNGLDDLAAMVQRSMTEPVNIVAQSMGGVIAIKLALAMPAMVNRLVLVATSGGIPVTDLGAVDWRPNYAAAFPKAASSISEPTKDYSERIRFIQAPTLLLWGDSDPISPVAVGERLAKLLPNAKLCIISEADHDLAQTHAGTVSSAIKRHLTTAR